MRVIFTPPSTLTLPAPHFPRRPRSGHRRRRTLFHTWTIIKSQKENKKKEKAPVRRTQSKNRKRKYTVFIENESEQEMEGQNVTNINGEKVTVKENQTENRKRKHKTVIKNENQNIKELEGENVSFINGEKVDLNMLARVGDNAYEEELEQMTKGMLSKVQLLGFMDTLKGHWCGRSERRKVVDAADIVNVLPIGWKVEIAVRRRRQLSSLYCRSYVSPTGMQFKSCKEAAIYLKDQSLIDVAGPSKQREMRQINNGSRVLLKSINEITNSSILHEANNNLLAGTNDLYDVEIVSFIDCSPCGLTFDDIGALNKHLAIFHKKTTRRFELPKKPHSSHKAQMDCGQHAVVGHDESRLGEASCSSQKIAGAEVPVAMINKNKNVSFRIECTWCNKEFLSEPVDAETMADAAGFMCPECKEKLCGVLERSLSRSYGQ